MDFHFHTRANAALCDATRPGVAPLDAFGRAKKRSSLRRARASRSFGVDARVRSRRPTDRPNDPLAMTRARDAFGRAETPFARVDRTGGKPRTFVVDADGRVTSNADDWRASKRFRSREGSARAARGNAGREGVFGGGASSSSSSTATVVAWTIDGASAPDVCVLESSSGCLARVTAPSALAPSCACARGRDGSATFVLATADGAHVVSVCVRDVDDFDAIDVERDVRVARAPSCVRGVSRLGACGSSAAVLCAADASVVVHAKTLEMICELQGSTLSRVWSTIKGGNGRDVAGVSAQSTRVGRKDLTTTMTADGFVQVWDVTSAVNAAEQLTETGATVISSGKVHRVCAAHLPPPPGTRNPPPELVAEALATSASADGYALRVVVSSRFASTDEHPNASSPGDATLALYTVKHGALAFTSSIEGSKGIARALAVTPRGVVAALERFDEDDDGESSTEIVRWPIDGLHRAREVRSGNAEANGLAEWGHSGRGNGAAVELLRRFGVLNGYTVRSVAESLASEISTRGVESVDALNGACAALGIEAHATMTDALVALAGSDATVARVAETWCRAAPAYAKSWARAHEPLSLIVVDDDDALVLMRSGGSFGAIRANDAVEDSLLAAKITNEDSPTLKFSAGGRQAQSALVALFARLNGVLGSSACAAMDLIAGGLCVDTRDSSRGSAFEKRDEQIEALSHNARDWLESFVGALVGDVFPSVSSEENEARVKARKASHRAKQRIIIRLLQDALSAMPDPAQTFRACLDAWSQETLDASDASAEASRESQRDSLVMNAAREQARARLAAARGMVLLLGCVRLGPKIGFPVDAAEFVADALPSAMRAYRSAALSSWLLTEKRSSANAPRDEAARLAVVLFDVRKTDSTNDRGLREVAALVGATLDAVGDDKASHTRRVVEIGTALYAAGELDALGTLLAFARQQVPGDDAVEEPFDSPAPLFLQALWTCADLVGLDCAEDDGGSSRPSVDGAIALFSRAAAFVPEVAGPVDPLLARLLRVIQSTLVGAADVFPEDAASRLEYYEIVMLFFERFGCAAGAAAAAHAALHEVRDDENQSARLWANALQYAVDARDWRAAYCAATSAAGDHRQAAAMRRLVASVCESGAKNGGAILSTLSLGEKDGTHYKTVVDALEGRASMEAADATPSPSEILYGFHMSRGDPAKAAVAMYEHAKRIGEVVREVCETPGVNYEYVVDALARHASALLSSANALSVLSDPCSVSLETVVQDAHMDGNDDLSTENVVSSGLDTKKSPLAAVTREYALVAARLELLNAGAEVSAIRARGEPRDAVVDLCESLAAYGCFKAATTLCTAWLDNEKLTSTLTLIAATMAARASMVQIGELDAEESAGSKRWNSRARDSRATAGLIGVDAPAASVQTYWDELRAFVERFDTQDRNFALSEACARAILSVDAELALPHWLVERFTNTERGLTGAGMARRGANPAALLRVYLAFERAEEAARLALKELTLWSRRSAIDRTAHAACWFPMNTILEARDRCANDASLRHLGEALSAAIDAHGACVEKDSAMLAQVSA